MGKPMSQYRFRVEYAFGGGDVFTQGFDEFGVAWEWVKAKGWAFQRVDMQFWTCFGVITDYVGPMWQGPKGMCYATADPLNVAVFCTNADNNVYIHEVE